MHRALLVIGFASSILAGAACGPSSTVLPSPTSPTFTATPTPSPAAPPPATPGFQHLAGTWSGFMKITETTEGGLGHTLPFTLRITGEPQSYTGQFDLPRSDNNPILPFTSGVAGRLREDGFAVFSGSTTVDSSSIAAMEVPELVVKVDDMAGLAGTIRFVRRGKGRIDRYRAQILSASVQPTTTYPGGALEGHWIGAALIRACSGYCRVAVGYTREIEMVLRQSSNTLTGRGYFDSFGNCSGPCWLPLAGTADGHAITSLTGRLTQVLPSDYSGDHLMILSNLSATVDDLGRMHAQFVYSSEGKRFQGDFFRPDPATQRLTMESVWLTRQP